MERLPKNMITVGVLLLLGAALGIYVDVDLEPLRAWWMAPFAQASLGDVTIIAICAALVAGRN